MSDTGFHWGWRIGIFYVLFASVVITLVVLAMQQDVGLVREDYYAYGLKHDQRMAAQHNADILGSAVGVELEEDVVAIHIPREHGQTLDGEVHLYHPSTTTDDVRIALEVDDSGTMNIPVQELIRGKWKVIVTWKVDNKVYEHEQELEF